MKVILNEDVKYLGEMGDVKTVANGYARNYLFPRSLALPYNDVTVAWFDSRKEEIEARKQAKRADSASLKEKLTAYTLTIVMTAGPNGKLYGAVTAQTVADALAKDGFEIERKRIDVPGVTIKSVGKYTVTVRLYEAETAEIPLIVEAQKEPEAASSSKAKSPKKDRRSFDAAAADSTSAQDSTSAEESSAEPAAGETADSANNETDEEKTDIDTDQGE
ncbi:50S ribosomal protein L9 [Treponema sp. OMZ 840]|uniref:50S ribosomal protein L9 n=1 Tax=Treponema sp. OMZ 840 TaxID=244313 RepID=UPI003D8FBC04